MKLTPKTVTTLSVVLILSAAVARFAQAASTFPLSQSTVSGVSFTPGENLFGIACIVISLALVALTFRRKSQTINLNTDSRLSAKMSEMLPEWHSDLRLQDLEAIIRYSDRLEYLSGSK